MNAARVRALELAIQAVAIGTTVATVPTGNLDVLQIAEVFFAWIDPPAPVAAGGDDYPRVQGVAWADPGPGGAALPDRY